MLLSLKIGTDHNVKQKKVQARAETGKEKPQTALAFYISRCSQLMIVLNKVYVIHCRDSHRFLPSLDYHAALAAGLCHYRKTGQI